VQATDRSVTAECPRRYVDLLSVLVLSLLSAQVLIE